MRKYGGRGRSKEMQTMARVGEREREKIRGCEEVAKRSRLSRRVLVRSRLGLSAEVTPLRFPGVSVGHAADRRYRLQSTPYCVFD